MDIEDESIEYVDEPEDIDEQDKDDSVIDETPQEPTPTRVVVKIVRPEERRTSHILSMYEATHIIATRAAQIESGSTCFADNIKGIIDPIEMAKAELLQRKCPLLIRRKVGNDKIELWSPNDMTIPHEIYQ
jgi:RNA polymerase Rpb6.